MAVGASMGNIKHAMDGTVTFFTNVFFVGFGVTLIGILISIQQFLSERLKFK